MDNSPLVSIITPTYNHEKFIGQCIESVLAQDYAHWQQIIVDDGSNDDTQNIAAGYQDNRIKYVHQEHLGIGGLSRSYNRALDIAEGELIAILEGDDYWPAGKLRSQVPVFQDQEVVLSWGKMCQVDNSGRTLWIGPKHLKSFRDGRPEAVLHKLLLHNFVPACTVMCRRRALLAIGGFRQTEGTPYVDYPTWLELTLVGTFAAVDEVMGYWRSHPHQMTSTAVEAMFEGGGYAIDFYNRMPPELAYQVGVTIEKLLTNHRQQIRWALFNRGRIALINRSWQEAKRSFKMVLSEGSPLQRMGALLGLLCTRLRVDAEWAAGITGRPRFR